MLIVGVIIAYLLIAGVVAGLLETFDSERPDRATATNLAIVWPLLLIVVAIAGPILLVSWLVRTAVGHAGRRGGST